MLAERDAEAAERATTHAQTQQALQGASLLGELQVEQGASGARTDVGAPFLVRRQMRRQLDVENALIGMQGRARAGALRSEAAIQTLQKNIFRKASKQAVISGWLGAGAAGLQTMALKAKYYPPAVSTCPESLRVGIQDDNYGKISDSKSKGHTISFRGFQGVVEFSRCRRRYVAADRQACRERSGLGIDRAFAACLHRI
jgi:hypothetical protein